MKLERNSYVAYSLACAAVWALALLIASQVANASKRHDLVVVCLGWFLGWLSASIARVVYPPPRSRRFSGPR